MNFDFICDISLEFSKMGITFGYELGLISFLYEKSSTRKVTSEFKHFQNPQKPKRKKLWGFSDLEGENGKKFKLTSGAPFARCATSSRKNWFQNIFLETFFKI